jgi:membrane fusion protein (multidrug efflux system)
MFVLGHGRETTDDAQVDGHIANIGSRVAGRVDKVLVQDNQEVKPGDVLIEQDKDELTARLAAAAADEKAAQASLKAAEAQLAIAEAAADRATPKGARPSVSSSRANLEQTKADLDSVQSRLHLALTELDRAKKLRKDGVISAAEYDARQSAFDQARAALDQASARLTSAKIGNEITAPAQVEAARAAVDLGAARVAQAGAALKLAEVNLSYATVHAPIHGLVSRRTVEEGQIVAPGTPLMALVPLDDVWIVANFKEDQIADMRAGQPVKIRIDTFGGRDFHGTVESIASSTGAKFALLPPDNASGNFVKVVQRIPVRIKIEVPRDITLRPGMSADVTVDTRVKG